MSTKRYKLPEYNEDTPSDFFDFMEENNLEYTSEGYGSLAIWNMPNEDGYIGAYPGDTIVVHDNGTVEIIEGKRYGSST